jgi:adenylate cyclase
MLWQVEALVQDAVTRPDPDDTTARLLTLDRSHEFAPTLKTPLVHPRRRQTAPTAGPIAAEFGEALMA